MNAKVIFGSLRPAMVKTLLQIDPHVMTGVGALLVQRMDIQETVSLREGAKLQHSMTQPTAGVPILPWVGDKKKKKKQS